MEISALPIPAFALMIALGAFVFLYWLPYVAKGRPSEDLRHLLINTLRYIRRLIINTLRYSGEYGGYVHDTHVSHWISPNMCSYVTGTWSDAVGAVTGTVVKEKTAADNTGVVYIPISAAAQSNSSALKGSYIKSIDIYWATTTAALDAAGATALIDQFLLPINGAAFPTLVAIPFTYDTGNDTAAETDDLDEHRMTLTLTTPFWLDDGDLIQVRLTMDAATTSVIRFHGARVNITLRL
jgi:hypothetical protein